MNFMKNWVLAAAIAFGTMANAVPIVKNAPSLKEAKKEVCGCGDICHEKHVVFCHLPACSREHGHPVMAVALKDKDTLSRALKKIGISKKHTRPKHKKPLPTGAAAAH